MQEVTLPVSSVSAAWVSPKWISGRVPVVHFLLRWSSQQFPHELRWGMNGDTALPTYCGETAASGQGVFRHLM